MDELFWTLVVIIVTLLWRGGWKHRPFGTRSRDWIIRVRGHNILYWHLLLGYATYLMVRFFIDVVLYDYLRIGHIAEIVAPIQHRIMLIPSFVAPLVGLATIGISWYCLIVVDKQFHAERNVARERVQRNTSSDERFDDELYVVREKIDLSALMITMPPVFAAHALKAQIHMLAILLQSATGEKAKLELGTCIADLMLGLAFQYLLVRSFLKFCVAVLEKADEESCTDVKVIGQKITVGIPFTERCNYELPIGNLEILVLNLYCLFGLVTTSILFCGVIAVNLKNLPQYQEEVAELVHWTTNQMAPASHVFTVLVFVSSKLLLQREAIKKVAPQANAKWTASRWLLMAPLQLTAFKYVMTHNWALLMHASFLAFESLFVVVYNARVLLKDDEKYTNDNNQQPLLGSE